MRLTAADLSAVPRELLEPVPDEHVRYLARDLVAGEIDRWLRVLGHQEACCRAVFGRLAAVFLRQRAAHRLGFRRVGDYARERLGLSARELQSVARVVTVLGGLPRLAAAFEAGVFSWTQLRILVTVVTPATEAYWLDLARGRTVRALEALVRTRRVGAGPAAPPDDTGTPMPTVVSGAARENSETGYTEQRAHCEVGHCETGADSATTVDAPDNVDAARAGSERWTSGDREDSQHSEDVEDVEDVIVRFHLRCPRRVRRLWRRAVELARRMLGRDGPVWQAAEAIAAEGLAAVPVAEGAWGIAMGDAAGAVAAISGAGVDAIKENHGERRGNGDDDEDGTGERPLAWECLDWSAVCGALPAEVERLADGCERLDAFALDARLRQVLQAQRRIDWQLGRLLDTCVRLRLERLLGFSSIAIYARERLGLSPSKVRGLIAVERTAREVPAFGAAYEAGELSWVRALALLPVLGESTAAAWTARAQAVTVRRLVAEVDWGLDQRDAAPEAAAGTPPGPPPAGHDLAADAAGVEPQMRARRKWSPVEEEREARPDWIPLDAEIAFAGPAAVLAVLQAAVAAFRRPGEPRWTGLERLLDHVIGEWESLPRHADPIFDRDGWRCVVPACEARGNLHDHHLQFRSHGGSNALENRVAVCAWHHLRGIHAGLVRASGTAPKEVRWELGLRAGQPPLLRLVGDTYVRGEGCAGGKACVAGPGALVARGAEAAA